MMKNPAFLAKIFLHLGVIACFIGCSNEQSWTFNHQISLPEKVRPLAMAEIRDTLWISDPQNFRVLKVDSSGRILDSIGRFQRPMNIGSFGDKLYVPEFLTDTIWELNNKEKHYFPINTNLQGPAGITVHQDTMAIADFYSHRIVLQSGNEVNSIGSRGHDSGQMYYPIDVEIHKGRVFVADAYNHRIQIFNDEGTLQKIIGVSDTLKVTSGINISDNMIFVTAQEQDRVMVYDHEGNLLQRLTEKIRYPTDVLLKNDTLYIANFKANALSVFVKGGA